ncbi:MAG: PstS family phosphate ABC transporter substrate-binding protein [Rhodospirillales bacterium]|nr:PstS family phosphate ABC transporter substrate-binding protein [Rhodospirillales bacterium]
MCVPVNNGTHLTKRIEITSTHVRPAVAGLLAAALTGTTLGVAGAEGLSLDPKLADYKAVSGVSGSLKSIGSDTLNNLMTLWAEGFKAAYPNVKIEIEGKGSSTAPPALVGGTAQFGPMSRPMKGKEVDDFEKRFGYKPIPIRSAVDALAVFVHKDNPIKCLMLRQVDAVFSRTRKGGHNQNVAIWGQLGLTGEWASRPLSLYGRNSASGTYGYFKEVALFNGDYKDSVKEQPGSSTVVQGVATDKGAIGYSGIGYKTADVRAVPLAAKPGTKCFDATADNAYAGDYPLSRFLYIYVNVNPNQPLDPLRAEFVRYVYSKQGQQAVLKDGYFPITASIAEEDLKSMRLR